MKIIEIDYGTGNRIGNKIYINKDLKKYPGLYEAVLAHELRHTGNFKFEDLTLDIINEDLKAVRGDWLRFIFTHPRAWVNFFPVMKLEGEWTFDASIFLAWSIAIFLFIFGWWLIK